MLEHSPPKLPPIPPPYHFGDLDVISSAGHEEVKQSHHLIGVELHPELVLHNAPEVLSAYAVTFALGDLVTE